MARRQQDAQSDDDDIYLDEVPATNLGAAHGTALAVNPEGDQDADRLGDSDSDDEPLTEIDGGGDEDVDVDNDDDEDDRMLED